MAAPQPRAERAVGVALRDLVGHHRIGVLVLDAVRYAVLRQEFRQDVFREIRLALVEVAGEQLDRQQPAPFQVEQYRQQSIGILAARQRHQPALARLRHREILDRLAHIAQQALSQLVELDRWRAVAEERVTSVNPRIRFKLLDEHVHDEFPGSVRSSSM